MAVKQDIYRVFAALFVVEFAIDVAVEFVVKYAPKSQLDIRSATSALYKLVWWLGGS